MKRLAWAVVLMMIFAIGACTSKKDTAHGATSSEAVGSSPAAPATTPVALRSRNVSRDEFGSKWPLTVGSGRVNCTPVSGGRVDAVFTANNGHRYALNGTALDDGSASRIDPIWADDSNTPGLKINIAVLTEICTG